MWIGLQVYGFKALGVVRVSGFWGRCEAKIANPTRSYSDSKDLVKT